MTAAESKYGDTLYYDGQCGLCAGEIAELRKRRGDELALVDIHQLPSSDAQNDVVSDSHNDGVACEARTAATQWPGRDKDLLLRTLHLRKSDGSWLTGADANVAAWQGTKRGHMLGVLRWPIIRLFVDLGYKAWAWWRYRRLYGRQFQETRHAPAKH